MKRILPVLFALTALASFSSAAEAKLRVVTTLQDFASIAQAIGGDRVDTAALAKGYQDPHFVDAKPSFVLVWKVCITTETLRTTTPDAFTIAGSSTETGTLSSEPPTSLYAPPKKTVTPRCESYAMAWP